MTHSPMKLARLALACGCLALVCDRVLGQVVVGGGMALQIIGNVRRAAPAHLDVPGVNMPAIEGNAIGDPWWDEAEPADAAGEPAATTGAENDPVVEQQVQMLVPNFRQLGLRALRSELSIVRQTCPSLDRQQRALVLAAGRGAIATCIAEHTAALRQKRRTTGRPNDVMEAVGTALRASVAANATAEESAAYEAERRLRQERVKQAAAAALVAEVDRDAFLDEAEREALGKAFAASFRERWLPALAAVQQGMAGDHLQNLPGIDRCVEQALGKERTAAWLEQRAQAQKLAAGMPRRLPPHMQPRLLQPGPLQLRVEAFGNGGQQQVIVNGKQVFVGNAEGGVQLRVQADGGVQIQPGAKDANAEAAAGEDKP